jgi:hypothetical protein
MPKGMVTRILATAFVISFFLPAYEGLKGYECAWFCIVLMVESNRSLWGLLYYPAFDVTNLFMIFLFATGISGRRIKRRKIINGLSIVLLAHTLSWAVLHLMKDSDFSDVQIGYYLWFLSMAGLVFLNLIAPGKGDAGPVTAALQAVDGEDMNQDQG